MKPLLRANWIIVAGLLAGVQSVYAQQPPHVVKSDLYGDTAMGTNALLSDEPTSGSPCTGCNNTAAGNNAMQNNTTGQGKRQSVRPHFSITVRVITTQR